jgi:GNAT superfamily N-acetyltransferase
MTVDIRSATEGDLPRLIELYAQLSLDQPREDASQVERYIKSFAEITPNPRHRILVAENTGGPVLGSVTLIIVPNLTYVARPFALIENVVVDAGARGKGIGESLIRQAIELAREEGCYRVSLTSNKRRQDAHKFYERLGFTASHEGFQLRF